MKNVVLTRHAYSLTATVEGTGVSVEGRDENEVFAELLRNHAAQLDVTVTYAPAPTATPEHLVAVLKGEDRDAVYGPVPLRELFYQLAQHLPLVMLTGRIDGARKSAEEWATSVRQMDATEPAFLKRVSSRGPRALEVVLHKTGLYQEVTTSQTPGYEPPAPSRAATGKRGKK